jgi:hypothetical protein
MTQDPRLAVQQVLLVEAAEIAAAREKCLILHQTSDIDAAGDEVEICVRNLLRRRLGHNYYVGHGHIVDAQWKVSPQFDVIVADSSVIPSMFRSENGAEYFPFESVYAVGEIKATYNKSKKPVEEFVKKLAKIGVLNRPDVPANYIRGHSGGFYLGEGLVSADRKGRQNELFAFMLFAGRGDFDVKDVVELYSTTAPAQLPNVVCLLDKGLITYTQFDNLSRKDWKAENVSFLSYPARPLVKANRSFAWTHFSNASEEPRALIWGVFYSMLVQFLMNTTVKPESPVLYIQQLATSPLYTFISEPDTRDDGGGR